MINRTITTLFATVLWTLLGGAVFAGVDHEVTHVEVTGADRTDVDWLLNYVDVSTPTHLTDDEVEALRRKLLTTQVFSQVTITFKSNAPKGRGETMMIDIDEKWTLLPILRGAYGGGTPVTIIGSYNIHSFGRLWTLGGEAQKYGDAPVGGVIWARAPRWLKGKHVLGGELWRDYRIRNIYRGLTEEDQIGTISTNATMFRGLFLAPINQWSPMLEGSEWQAGIDLRVRREAPAKFTPLDTLPSNTPGPTDIILGDEPTTATMPMLAFIYDNMFIDNLDQDGARITVKGGPEFAPDGQHGHYEIESFYYWLWDPHWELGTHFLIGGSESNNLQSTYFLGGLDTIRGIPDGAVYGPRAMVFNAEFKKIMPKFKYLWLQNCVFADWGGAGDSWKLAYESQKASAGVGVRMTIPQVYRLVVRIDYAWSLDRPGVSGISIGTAQFIQPYKPL